MEAVAGPWDGVAQLDPRGAQPLLDLLAPELAAVAAAVFPLLTAHGLSPAEATIDDVLAVEGLADAVVGAATAAVSQTREFGWLDVDVTMQVTASPLLVDRALTADETLSGLEVAQAPPATRGGELPEGWLLHVDVGPRYLEFDEDGAPCYPNAPPFEEFWPKCPQPDEPADVPDVPCLEDSRFVRAEARLREPRNFARVPTSFRGFDYREELEWSVFRPVDELYRCGAEQSDPSLLASWHGPPDDATIRIYEPFLDLGLGLGFDLVSVISGPVDFRAAILLHEHVHRIEDPQMGTVSAPADRDYHPVGSRGQDDCPLSGTEYDAAYIQALYLGGGEATARMVADIYGRRQCHQLSRGAQLLAAAGDIIEVLALGWLPAIEVLATLTGRLASNGAAALLAALFPAGIAGLVLLGLPCEPPREIADDVLTGRAPHDVSTLVSLVHASNPTDRGLRPALTDAMYARKARLQKLLLRWRRRGARVRLAEVEPGQHPLVGGSASSRSNRSGVPAV